MINSIDISSKLAIDTKGIDDIRLMSKKDPDKALHEVAKQFEIVIFAYVTQKHA